MKSKAELIANRIGFWLAATVVTVIIGMLAIVLSWNLLTWLI